MSVPLFPGLLLVGSATSAADWPQWHGPDGNDVTTENSGWTGREWPLEEVWRRDVGRGCTSPVVAGGRLYTMGWVGGKDSVYCLDAATGRDIWKQSYGSPRYGRHAAGDKGQYSSPMAASFPVSFGLGALCDLCGFRRHRGGVEGPLRPTVVRGSESD